MEKIHPAFSSKNIAVCFSANDKYAPLLATTIASIIYNSSKENNYDIVVLTTGISDENKTKLMTQFAEHPNFSLRFVNVGAYVYGYSFYIESDLTNTKYSDEIYFRVLVPTLFENYSKVVFLDADLVVRDDIAKLYNTDIGENLVGAVRDYEGIANCYNNNYERTKYRINEIGMKNFEDYFISGVMIINIDEFNKSFESKTLLDLAVSKDWKQYDQDLFNYICKGKAKIIDAEWDFVEDIDGIFQSMPEHLFREYVASEKNPKIIHYSASRKPWLKIDSKYNDDFWKYARLTKYNDYLISLKAKYE